MTGNAVLRRRAVLLHTDEEVMGCEPTFLLEPDIKMSKNLPPGNDKAPQQRETETPIREFIYYTRRALSLIEAGQHVCVDNLQTAKSFSSEAFSLRMTRIRPRGYSSWKRR